MTWLDSAIGWFSPRAGLRRAQARVAIGLVGQLGRSYEGAQTGRRTEGWIAHGTDANAEIAAGASRLRNRARDLVRNNAYAASAVKKHAANIVGCGIIPRATKRVDDLFARWSDQADADGVTDFYGLQSLVVRGLVEGGEVLIRRRVRADYYEAAPLRLQVLEGDYLDPSRDLAVRPGGGWIRNGIEYAADGTRLAYWLFQQHPGSTDRMTRSGFESVRVPANEILHVFDPLRAGQGRGVTWFAPALLKLRDLDDYEMAELVRKKTEACLTALVTTDDDTRTIGKATTTEDGSRIENFRPGMFEYLRPGEDVKFNQPSFAGGYLEYTRSQLHAIAVAVDLTYEMLTGDLSQVNFSSLRAGMLEFRRRAKQVQTQILLPQFLLPVWGWVTELGQASGSLPGNARVPVTWSYPRFESVQPLQDAMEELTRLRSGTLTLEDAIAARGGNMLDALAEIARANALLDSLGIVLDSDPRKVAKSGQVQATDPNATDAPAAPEGGQNAELAIWRRLMDSIGPPDRYTNGHG